MLKGYKMDMHVYVPSVPLEYSRGLPLLDEMSLCDIEFTLGYTFLWLLTLVSARVVEFKGRPHREWAIPCLHTR